MHKVYSIYSGDMKIGTANVQVCGLYYRINAICTVDNTGMHRLQAHGDVGDVDLGLLVPERDKFILCRDVPVKCLGEGELRFSLKGSNHNKCSIQLKSNEPFAYLTQLENARLLRKNGELAIVITMQESNYSDSSSETGQ